jgi:hypothetical protein
MRRYEFPLLFAFRLILYTTLIQSCAPLGSPLNGDNDITTHELVKSTLDNEDDTKASRIRRYGNHIYSLSLSLSSEPRSIPYICDFERHLLFRDYIRNSPLMSQRMCGIERTPPVFSLCGLVVIAWILVRAGQTTGHSGRVLFVASLVAPLLVRLLLLVLPTLVLPIFFRVLTIAPRFHIRVISGGLVIALHKIPLRFPAPCFVFWYRFTVVGMIVYWRERTLC